MSEECEDVVAHRNRSKTYFVLSGVLGVIALGAGIAYAYEADPIAEYSDEVFGLVTVLAGLGTLPLLYVAITERIEANKGCQHED